MCLTVVHKMFGGLTTNPVTTTRAVKSPGGTIKGAMNTRKGKVTTGESREEGTTAETTNNSNTTNRSVNTGSGITGQGTHVTHEDSSNPGMADSR